MAGGSLNPTSASLLGLLEDYGELTGADLVRVAELRTSDYWNLTPQPGLPGALPPERRRLHRRRRDRPQGRAALPAEGRGSRRLARLAG
jgi:hypothetical protein